MYPLYSHRTYTRTHTHTHSGCTRQAAVSARRALPPECVCRFLPQRTSIAQFRSRHYTHRRVPLAMCTTLPYVTQSVLSIHDDDMSSQPTRLSCVPSHSHVDTCIRHPPAHWNAHTHTLEWSNVVVIACGGSKRRWWVRGGEHY